MAYPYTQHHADMRAVKAPRPEACETCGRIGKVWLSLVGEATHTLTNVRYRYQGRRTAEYVLYQTPVSDDPAAYIWECPKCNQARRGGKFAKNQLELVSK
jgi:hypothetical protein